MQGWGAERLTAPLCCEYIMSYLSRTLKKQHRILKALESTPLIILSGLGLKKILVFPERKITPDNALLYSRVYQAEIDSGQFEDIRQFDAIHSADIEFSCFYRGKFVSRFRNQTKQRLVVLGNKWGEGFHRNTQTLRYVFSYVLMTRMVGFWTHSIGTY
jgi:hypothetical protein